MRREGGNARETVRHKGLKDLLESDSGMETPILTPHLIGFATSGEGWEAEYLFSSLFIFSGVSSLFSPMSTFICFFFFF